MGPCDETSHRIVSRTRYIKVRQGKVEQGRSDGKMTFSSRSQWRKSFKRGSSERTLVMNVQVNSISESFYQSRTYTFLMSLTCAATLKVYPM